MFIFSMVVFGTLAPFVRRISLTSGEIAMYRAVMAALLTGAWLLITGRKIPLKSSRRDVLLLLMSGAAMGFNWVLLFEAYKYTSVPLATLSYYFAPVIVILVSPLLFKEKLTARQVICSAVAALGLVLITVSGGSGGGDDLRGIMFGLGAAVLYATVMVMNKLIRSVDGIQRTFLQFIAAAAAVSTYVFSGERSGLSSLDGPGWVCLLIVGLIHTGFIYCLYFSSLKELPGQQAAILGYLDPLTALIVSAAVLGERLTWIQILGAVLIIGSSAVNDIGTEGET